MLMLRCVALMVLLSASAYANGGGMWTGPPFYWTDWEDQGECSVMCGSGILPQTQYAKCYKRFESPTCLPEDMPRVHYRNATCNTQPCGDVCPPGVDKFIPHPTNPSRFYQCAFERAFLHRCPSSTVWGQALGRCAWPFEIQ